MKKRITAIVLCFTMLFALVLSACGENGRKTEGNILESETVNLAILRVLWNDRTGEAIEGYANYLEENFNCKVHLITLNDSTGEEVIAGTENAITQGCDIIISTYTVGMEAACSLAKEAGAAFGVAYVTPNESELKSLAQYDNYIGSACTTSDGVAVGARMADTLIDDGYDNFAVTAFPEGMISAVDQRTEGFLKRAEERGANVVYVLREMAGPTMITAISTMLETYGDEIEYIVSYGGGTDFTVPAMTASEYTIPIAVPLLPNDFESYFETGILDYVLGYNEHIFALLFAAGVNYLNGDTLANTNENKIIECSDVVMRSLDDAALYDEITMGRNGNDLTFTAEELKSLIVAYNPNATFEDMLALAQSTDIAGIQARHQK